MKRIFLTIIFTLLLIASLALASTAASVFDNNDNEYFPTQENVFYLPSCIKPSNVTISVNNAKSQINLTSRRSEDANGNEIYTYQIDGEEYTFYFANSLPSIYVSCSLNLEYILGKQRKEDGRVLFCITDKNGNVEYKNDAEAYGDFKVRGNTTTDYKKQPFQMKFSKKQDLFGMGNAKSWVLLANYLDQSNIRNSVMYKIGELLGMDTCAFKSVDLYINGEYYGIYLLCEKVQIQPNRVNIYELEKDNELLNPSLRGYTAKVTTGALINETVITEYQYVKDVINPPDISGGYLIELDNNYYKDEKCYFKTSNGNAYVIKSPEYASKEQVEYIARVFAEMEEAIYSPTGKNSRGLHYSQYADIDSLVYAYIMAELGRNWDAGSSSMYFYKDRDMDGKFTKVVKGPLWDCDNTLGNMLKNNADSAEGFWAKSRSFWSALTKHDYFNYKVTEAFSALYPTLIEMTLEGGFISEQVKEIGSSIVMERARWNSDDYSKWPMYGDYVFKDVHYDTWQSSQTFQFINGSYSNGVDNDETTVIGYLKSHLINRANWLNSIAWVRDDSVNAPTISADGIIDTSIKMPVSPTFDTVLPPKDDNTDNNVDTSIVDSDSTNDNSDNDNDEKDFMPALLISALAIGAIAVVVLAIVIITKKKGMLQ